MVEAPGWTGASFTSCLQYSGWSITNTPRKSSGLAGGFAIKGLDRFFAVLCQLRWGLGYVHMSDNPTDRLKRAVIVRHHRSVM